MIPLARVGEIGFGKFKTEFVCTPEIKKYFEKEKLSPVNLMPQPWLWYEAELLDATDQNGDGKIDEQFGTKFKVIFYALSHNQIKINVQDPNFLAQMQMQMILRSEANIRGMDVKYICVKGN